MVYKNADDAFPLELRTTKASAAAAVDALNHLKGKVDANYESVISMTLLRIDAINATTQAQLRAAYVVFQGDPCNQSQYLAAEVAIIRSNEQNLRNTSFKVRTLMEFIQDRPKGALADLELSRHIAIQLDKVMEELRAPNKTV